MSNHFKTSVTMAWETYIKRSQDRFDSSLTLTWNIRKKAKGMFKDVTMEKTSFSMGQSYFWILKSIHSSRSQLAFSRGWKFFMFFHSQLQGYTFESLSKLRFFPHFHFPSSSITHTKWAQFFLKHHRETSPQKGYWVKLPPRADVCAWSKFPINNHAQDITMM